MQSASFAAGRAALGAAPLVSPGFSGGLVMTGSVANDFSASTGTFLTSSGQNTLNGTVVIPSTVSGGFKIYNTTDQVTNFERLEFLWNSNVGTIRTLRGGSGSQRAISLANAQGLALTISNNGSATLFSFAGSQQTVAGVGFGVSGIGSTITSGQATMFSLTPTYNQASGTASNTDFLINRTQTAIGSGAQKFLDFQISAASKFSVDTTGLITTNSPTMIASSQAFSNGAAAAAGTLTNAPVAGNPTKWIPINDNGTTRYLPAW